VTDSEGQTRGVVVVNVDLNSFFASLTHELPKDHQLFLANRQGDVLVHPDPAQTFGFDRGRRVLIQDEFAATRALLDGNVAAVMLEARDGRYAQAPVVAAFVASHITIVSEEERLVLGVAQPLEAVVRQADALGRVVVQLVLPVQVCCWPWGGARGDAHQFLEQGGGSICSTREVSACPRRATIACWRAACAASGADTAANRCAGSQPQRAGCATIR
jgi:hypothetical protein